MSHLTLEAIARLVDETPTATQREHLDRCERCRTELLGLRRQTRRLAALPDADPPPHAWTLLEARLQEEALVAATPSSRSEEATQADQAQAGSRPRKATRAGFGTSWSLRLAASIALFLLGGVVGATLRSSATPPTAMPSEGLEAPSARAPVGPGALPTTPEEAADVLQGAEASYLAALSRHLELNGVGQATDPMARLAALESIVLTTRAALDRAPADPVINGYHLTAVAEREATLRRLAASAADDWF